MNHISVKHKDCTVPEFGLYAHGDRDQCSQCLQIDLKEEMEKASQATIRVISWLLYGIVAKIKGTYTWREEFNRYRQMDLLDLMILYASDDTRRRMLRIVRNENHKAKQPKISAYRQAQLIARSLRKHYHETGKYGPKAYGRQWCKDRGRSALACVVWQGGPFEWTMVETGKLYGPIQEATHNDYFVECANGYMLVIYEN